MRTHVNIGLPHVLVDDCFIIHRHVYEYGVGLNQLDTYLMILVRCTQCVHFVLRAEIGAYTRDVNRSTYRLSSGTL